MAWLAVYKIKSFDNSTNLRFCNFYLNPHIICHKRILTTCFEERDIMLAAADDIGSIFNSSSVTRQLAHSFKERINLSLNLGVTSRLAAVL